MQSTARLQNWFHGTLFSVLPFLIVRLQEGVGFFLDHYPEIRLPVGEDVSLRYRLQ
jgi:hypothetical protein